ncbi:methylated-DNA--[protein]-cysteine S-methyltransferase [Robiginitalea aurantiaca]|uniref:Methylated-DNA--protein-cysteine methyltransferase n=1 Tax=Robiginitalea aurantiaca TaxID=3056915 RepID=A0ABT7WAP2_9FLAO|nr:methylated-DNA--[protein]-cysteine S-methyltransferase [Robiginitalea aurantiaca]MDM9629985.1 methylated-DNA--[protein]-cysteine S-methyltransferase [Robiginitalea aurantiaca]
MLEATIPTPLGTARIIGDHKGITEISVTDDAIANHVVPAALEPACRQLREYFEGSRETFDIPLHPEGTPFQRKVWAALLEIPFGQRISYLELAKRLGDPKSVRAVAGANAKNPVWILIPCHRVIGTDGSLTGYAGGLYRKKWLLNHESPSRQTVLFS